jgi:hypothetical protein
MDGSSLNLNRFIPAFASKVGTKKNEKPYARVSVPAKIQVSYHICLKPHKFNQILQSNKKGPCKEHTINTTG